MVSIKTSILAAAVATIALADVARANAVEVEARDPVEKAEVAVEARDPRFPPQFPVEKREPRWFPYAEVEKRDDGGYKSTDNKLTEEECENDPAPVNPKEEECEDVEVDEKGNVISTAAPMPTATATSSEVATVSADTTATAAPQTGGDVVFSSARPATIAAGSVAAAAAVVAVSWFLV
ncbi:hypothetical protein DFJ77DRAFT_460498 [Powellomyces hirtus]|nr:hypothetical protein DFJ77DRAFT_460498 [Powellomyces hirtus]